MFVFVFSFKYCLLWQLNQIERLKIETMKLCMDRAGRIHWVPDLVGTNAAVSQTERNHWQVRASKRLAIASTSYQSCVNAMNT